MRSSARGRRRKQGGDGARRAERDEDGHAGHHVYKTTLVRPEAPTEGSDARWTVAVIAPSWPLEKRVRKAMSATMSPFVSTFGS
jgi:hypothetical protein